MIAFEKCPVCGGRMIVGVVNKVLRGDGLTAILPVEAEVCHDCGETLYSLEAANQFERIRAELDRREFKDL